MGIVVANFMDSSLLDLREKGVFGSIAEAYNPEDLYARVLHFTPHDKDRAISAELASHKIEIIHHDVVGLQPRKMIRALFAILRIFRREHIDIVRGRLPYMGSLLGGIAARLVGIPFVVSLGGDNRIVQERNNSYYMGSRRLSYGIERLVLTLANRVIVPNQFTATYVANILGNAAARKKCVVIPWISRPLAETSIEDEAILQGLGIGERTFVVPIIGFINRYKFSDVLFEALASSGLTTADGRQVEICFVGDGPLRAEGEQRFEGRDDVGFFGWQQRKVVHALLRRADAVLIPMSGFVLLEAASIGKTVIAGSLEWHGEVIHDGESGYLVDPTRPEEWRAAIERAAAAPDFARTMGIRLHEIYEQELAPSVSVTREHALYEELTGKAISS